MYATRHLEILSFLLFGLFIRRSHAVVDLSDLNISGPGIVEKLRELATYSDDTNPAVTRVLFTGWYYFIQAG